MPGASLAEGIKLFEVCATVELLLAAHGSPADLSVEDYWESLLTLREVW